MQLGPWHRQFLVERREAQRGYPDGRIGFGHRVAACATVMGSTQLCFSRIDEVLERAVVQGQVPGVVAAVAWREFVHVAMSGVMAVGGAPMRRDTLFRISSMTKPITAVEQLSRANQGAKNATGCHYKNPRSRSAPLAAQDDPGAGRALTPSARAPESFQADAISPRSSDPRQQRHDRRSLRATS